MIQACILLGAKIDVNPTYLTIHGVAGKPQTPEHMIDAGNSGQVLRFIAAIAALCDGYTVLTGDASLRTNRPIAPLLDGLTGLGVFAVATRNNGYAPVIIKGPLQGGSTQLEGADSQPVSGLLIAAAFAPKPTRIEVSNPGETPWIELTLAWLARLGIQCQHHAYGVYELSGGADYPGFRYTVPGDFSSAAFPMAAGLVTRSAITLTNLDWQDVQGDKALFDVLPWQGGCLDINAYIDALPILAVLACFAETPTEITGAAIARCKESDRIAAITQELRKMGAIIDEKTDGLVIQPARLHGAELWSHHDHRIAMALVVAALGASGASVIQDIACVDKSYPYFARDLHTLGAAIELCVWG
jgi:3-phosphoshikimate 1-carboxyvinyltransferase